MSSHSGNLEFVGFSQVDPEDLLVVLNESAVRRHLVDHDRFDSATIREWMGEKLRVDAVPGCRIRAVRVDGALAGWCGIQPDDGGRELAIVLSQQYWGLGVSIFESMMGWAAELGHEEVVFHLLDTRPEYRALKRRAARVERTRLLGRIFTTYVISVEKWRTG